MRAFYLTVPVSSIQNDLHSSDTDPNYIYEHLRYTMGLSPSKIMPMIELQWSNNVLIATGNRMYLRVALDLTWPHVRAIIRSNFVDIKQLLGLLPSGIKELPTEVLQRESSLVTARSVAVIFFSSPLSSKEKELFNVHMTAFFGLRKGKLSVSDDVRIRFEEKDSCAVLEAEMPVGDWHWTSEYMEKYRTFSTEVKKIVSIGGWKFT